VKTPVSADCPLSVSSAMTSSSRHDSPSTYARVSEMRASAGPTSSDALRPIDSSPWGQTRCYWTVNDADLRFRYCDPVLSSHLKEVRWPSFLLSLLLDRIVPGHFRSGPHATYCKPCMRQSGGNECVEKDAVRVPRSSSAPIDRLYILDSVDDRPDAGPLSAPCD
jgi:hypothetical protein